MWVSESGREREGDWLYAITCAFALTNNHLGKSDQRPDLIASEPARCWEFGTQSHVRLRQIGFITSP